MTNLAYHLHDALEICKAVCDKWFVIHKMTKKKTHVVLRISRVCPVHNEENKVVLCVGVVM